MPYCRRCAGTAVRAWRNQCHSSGMPADRWLRQRVRSSACPPITQHVSRVFVRTDWQTNNNAHTRERTFAHRRVVHEWHTWDETHMHMRWPAGSCTAADEARGGRARTHICVRSRAACERVSLAPLNGNTARSRARARQVFKLYYTHAGDELTARADCVSSPVRAGRAADKRVRSGDFDFTCARQQYCVRVGAPHVNETRPSHRRRCETGPLAVRNYSDGKINLFQCRAVRCHLLQTFVKRIMLKQ